MAGTTIVDRLNKLSGKDATTIAKALENLEEGGGIGGFEIHICTSEEYDSSTHVPTVTNPDASTLYLVPTSSKSKNMFDEYVWTGTDWEKFGTGSVALPSPTTADNGKVLGVSNGEYALTNARSDIPKASAANAGKVLGVTANGGMYAFVDKDSSVEQVIFNGAYAYKVGKIAYVSYTGNGIMFPPIGQGGLTVQSGSLEVADVAVSGSNILAYVRGADATKRYAVVAGNNNGKAQLYLLDATSMTPVSETVIIWDNFCIPCK